jgi:hypothetical protein
MGVDRLLTQGLDHTTIAARLWITEYVVGVVDEDELGKGRPQPPDLYDGRAPNHSDGVDTATIRMIARMLQMKQLTCRQIAREAGVSLNIVEDVAMGRRTPITKGRPIIFKDLGERFLENPIRCAHCGAMISITPCRACRAVVS